MARDRTAASAPAAPDAVVGHPASSVRRFLGRFGWAVLWQVLGKLIGLAGLSYAFRCLGPEAVGVSGTVLATVLFVQMVLDFGLDIIAVRHVAAGTAKVADLVTALCSLRLLLGVGAFVLVTVGVLWLPLPTAVRWVWWFGGLHLAFLNLGFSWYFQATERMPAFSLLQNATTVVTSLVFLAAFRPGQRVGSDLVVTLGLNAVVTVGVWLWVRRRHGVRLFHAPQLRLAGRLFREAHPIWVFNLSYCALGAMNLPLCSYFLGDREAGYFRSAAMLVSTLQVFLNYFGLMLNPRIVQWRAVGPGKLRKHLRVLTGLLVACGGVSLAAMWLVRHPLVRFLWGAEFMPAAAVLPVLVSAKFLALASGLLVWGLFAHYREWLAVACCVPPLVLAFALNMVWIPRYGIVAAAWLNLGAELALLGLCLWALYQVDSHRARRS